MHTKKLKAQHCKSVTRALECDTGIEDTCRSQQSPEQTERAAVVRELMLFYSPRTTEEDDKWLNNEERCLVARRSLALVSCNRDPNAET